MLFTEEERRTFNVQGKLGKKQLDVKKISYINDLTFKLYPLQGGEDRKKSWAECIKAIDEGGRHLNKLL